VAKLIILNLIVYLAIAISFAFFLKSTIERHTNELDMQFKPLLECSLIAFTPSLIASLILIGTGIWQVSPDSSGDINRSPVYDVLFFVFHFGSAFIILRRIFQQSYMVLIESLDIEFYKVFLFTTFKSLASLPVILVVVALGIFPFLP
jgi:hypothetical protein